MDPVEGAHAVSITLAALIAEIEASEPGVCDALRLGVPNRVKPLPASGGAQSLCGAATGSLREQRAGNRGRLQLGYNCV